MINTGKPGRVLPAPPAWVMPEPSNSVEKLDKLFSIYGETSSSTKQP
ncbi:lysis system o-spanin lipoprotein Rz1 [Pseudomonas sp. 5]|nr:lysis system o-spanin lipoprotein Rz1 [Pseudomonas sp. 5]